MSGFKVQLSSDDLSVVCCHENHPWRYEILLEIKVEQKSSTSPSINTLIVRNCFDNTFIILVLLLLLLLL